MDDMDKVDGMNGMDMLITVKKGEHTGPTESTLST